MSRVIGEVRAPKHSCGCGHNSHKNSHKNSHRNSDRSNKHSWGS